MARGEVAAQQRLVPRILALARGLLDHVPCESKAPHRDEAEQEESPDQIAGTQHRGDDRDADEPQAPRHVDDVVAPDAAADRERDAVHEQQRGDGRGGDEKEVHRVPPAGAKVHWNTSR